LFWTSGAAAQQTGMPQGSAVSSGVGDALARNLRLLSQDPKSLIALMGAGRASLEGGDAQAALTFFARAEEVAPRDGRIKMWIGSALVQLEQPRPALKFFDEAMALGVSESDVAGDRGLVYDMLGDPRRAQQDYQLALRHGADSEVTRRLALSYGISGDRERALQLLEDQLLVRDPAAARTRALVLALTGDTEGADRAAQAAMPGAQAQAMAPFLARLPTLSLADRALAVHFGHFPGSGPPAVTGVDANVYAALTPITNAGAPDATRPALGSRTVAPAPAPVSTAPRRRPGSEAQAEPVRLAPANAGRGGTAEPSATIANRTTNRPTAALRDRIATTQPPVGTSRPAPTRSTPTLAVRERRPEPAPSAGPPAASAGRLAEVAAALADLPDDAPAATAPQPARTSPAQTTARNPARTAATLPAASSTRPGRAAAPAAAKKTTPPPPREPSRVWVQIAGGANASSLPREYARLKAKAPKLLGSRPAWTAPINATNRLLVGPFATTHDAQAFINELSKSDVAGFAWTSAAGQRIERLPAR
jgi:Flp pilus assembly protein TadD